MLVSAGQSCTHKLPTFSNTLAHAQWKNMHDDAKGKRCPWRNMPLIFYIFPEFLGAEMFIWGFFHEPPHNIHMRSHTHSCHCSQVNISVTRDMMPLKKHKTQFPFLPWVSLFVLRCSSVASIDLSPCTYMRTHIHTHTAHTHTRTHNCLCAQVNIFIQGQRWCRWRNTKLNFHLSPELIRAEMFIWGICLIYSLFICTRAHTHTHAHAHHYRCTQVCLI